MISDSQERYPFFAVLIKPQSDNLRSLEDVFSDLKKVLDDYAAALL